PPIWAAPIELSAVLLPPATDPVPPTPVVVPVGVREADAPGDALSAPDWTAPVDPFDVLPPPIWTTPDELLAVLSPPAIPPEPPVDAEPTPSAPAVSDGVAETPPT